METLYVPEELFIEFLWTKGRNSCKGQDRETVKTWFDERRKRRRQLWRRHGKGEFLF